MRKTCGRFLVIATLCGVPVSSFAQDAAQAGQTAQDRRAERGGQPVRPGARGALPPLGRGMDAPALQAHLDAWALQQAQRELKLSEEQYPNFVAKLTRLQNLRRRTAGARRQLLGELRGLLDSPTPKDEAIGEKVRALEDLNRRGTEEAIKAYQELDGTLTPWQRGRFRLFEEQLERKKVELLTRLGAR